MNERIRELAEQAGYKTDMFGIGHWDMPECKKFAALVAEHEREECLKLVDEQIHNMTVLDSYPEQSGAIYQAIINIRARGSK
jgi:hypothetical protein